MILWVDAPLSPQLVPWISETFPCTGIAIRTLGLRDAADADIFQAARKADAAVLTKDYDLVMLLEQRGPPPRIIWITCGNTSNAVLKNILSKHLPHAMEMLAGGEPLVEIGSGWR